VRVLVLVLVRVVVLVLVRVLVLVLYHVVVLVLVRLMYEFAAFVLYFTIVFYSTRYISVITTVQ
jgi:hypothetical protein